MATTDLENEAGHPGGLSVAPWSFFKRSPSEFVVDPVEDNPDLRFPESVQVYETMKRTDPQVSANLRAMTQPILGAGWDLAGDDVDPAVMEFVRAELGLVVEGDPRRRRRRHGVVLRDHLRDALTCLPHGFSAFEQVYQYNRQDGRLHLRKLAPRPQRSIRDIYVARDGGLVAITQEPAPSRNLKVASKPVDIPVERLVWYVLDKEGADWTGTSVFRSAYKPWLLKDRSERILAQAIERNSMGVPVAMSDATGEERHEIDRQLSRFRAGAQAYAHFPQGVQFKLETPGGGLVDALPAIKRWDEQISKSMLAMFLDLGHDAGARSLGDTFVDVFLNACQAVADSVADTVTEHVIRDLVEHNWGPDAAYPVLTPGNLINSRGLAVEGLKSLSDGGLLTPDAKLEGALRTRYGLPEADPATAAPRPSPDPVAALSEPGHLAEQHRLMDRLEELRRNR